MKNQERILIDDLFVNRMEQYRAEMNLSQAEFASKIGFSLSGYKKILRCETNSVSFERYKKLCAMTQKVFWVAYYNRKHYTALADIIDNCPGDINHKLAFFSCMCKLNDDLIQDNCTLIEKDIEIMLNYFSSETYKLISRLFEELGIPRKSEFAITVHTLLSVCPKKQQANRHFKFDNNELLYRIERFRSEKGCSQAEFAKALGYSLSWYKKLLNGRDIKIVTMLQMSHYLDAVSILTAWTGGNTDKMALALDENIQGFELKSELLKVFDVMEWELEIPQAYIDRIVELIRKLGEILERAK